MLCQRSPPPKKSPKVDNEIGSSTYETRKREKARAKYMDILAQTATWQMEKKNKLFYVCLKKIADVSYNEECGK